MIEFNSPMDQSKMPFSVLRNSLFIQLVLLALLTLQQVPSFAQCYHTRTYREQDGLASNMVFNAAQDSRGNLWFATRNGLTVYDGVEWRTTRTTKQAFARGEGLVTIDDNGTIWWVAKRMPLRVCQKKDGKWRDVPPLRWEGMYWSISGLETWVDPTGVSHLLVSASNGYLWHWNGKVWQTLTLPKPCAYIQSLARNDSLLLISTNKGLQTINLESPEQTFSLPMGLPDGPVRAVSTNPTTGISWVVGDQWLAKLQNLSLEQLFPLPDMPPNTHEYPASAHYGPNGGIYFVGRTYICYFHPQSGLEIFSTSNGISAENGNHVLMDREKNIWICSDRGINKIISRRFICYDRRHGLLGDEVSSIIQRSSGAMVLGHRKGLTFLDTIPRTLSFVTTRDIYSRVTDMAEDTDGNLWIAADHQGLGLLKNEGPIQWFGSINGFESTVYSILPHPDHGLFIGTNTGLYQFVDSKFHKIEVLNYENVTFNNIRRLIPLADGGFAIATREYGIFLWHEGIISHFPGNDLDGSNNTYTVFEHPDGRLWVGTGSGLRQVGTNNLIFPSSGSPEIKRPIYSILQDDSGRFWFGTDEGVTIWDGHTQNRLTTQEGLLGNETNRDALLKDHNGHIWVGTDSGVSIYRPEFDTQPSEPPVLSLTDMIVNGKHCPVDLPLRLEGPLASLVFIFRAPTFSTENQVQFSAQTIGDSNFDFPLHIHWPGVLPLTNIPPGTLQIQIQACTSEGLNTNIITTPLITIVPPLGDRWYIRALMVLAGLLLMWLILAYFSGRRYAGQLEDEVSKQIKGLRTSEENARLESKRLAGTLESISDGVLVLNGQGEIILLNQAAESMFIWANPPQLGCTLDKVVPPSALVDPEQSARYQEFLANPVGIRLLSEHVPLQCNSQDIQWFEISCVPVTDSSGGLVFAFRNITSRRKKEQEEHRAQKLESLGLLAGGIAHDFNNLLAIMLGNLSLAEGTLSMTPAENQQFGRIRHASHRARNLTHQLLTFAKGGGPVRTVADLGPVIKDCIALSLSGSNVNCRLVLAPDLWWARVDVGQISQVIDNLVINAFQAMPNGGQLDISAENAIGLPGFAPDERLVVIKIQDYGQGIPEKDLTRIFDPYFSTKETGSGLGLAIAHSIVKKHGGQLTVETIIGHGSTFRLVLLATEETLENPAIIAGQRTATSTQPLNILVMDDEEGIRQVMGKMLTQMGHKWIGVPDGETAIKSFTQAKNNNKPLDLVILDLTIPGGIGGLKTLSKLRKLSPQVKAIVTSGYSDDPVMANYQEFGFDGVLAKPFTQGELQAETRKCYP